jgi:hypothetical protein
MFRFAPHLGSSFGTSHSRRLFQASRPGHLILVREVAPLYGDSSNATPSDDADALEELEEEIAILAAHIHAATHRLLTLIADFDQRRGWELGGHRSCAHWLSARTGIDLGAAREKVRTARVLEGLPQTSACMARGELSFSQVRALSRVATEENEGDLLELARECTTSQLERMVRAFRRGSRDDEAALEERRHESRTLSVFSDEEGMYVVKGRLTAEVGALLMRAVEAASDALYREKRNPGVGREAVNGDIADGGTTGGDTAQAAAQLRADALGLLAERALAVGFENAPISGTQGARFQVVLHVDSDPLDPVVELGRSELEDGTRVSAETSRRLSCDTGLVRINHAPDGSILDVGRRTRTISPALRRALAVGCDAGPISGTRAERYQVVLHVDSDTLDPEGEPGRSELEDGTRVSAETSRRLSCDTGLVRIDHAPDGSILDVGRRTRTISPALRRALEARDRGCRFPGCGLRFADAHHVRHWADGGETSLGNTLLLCHHHHRLVHEGGWRVGWWGSGRPVFFDPRGGTHFEGGWQPREKPLKKPTQGVLQEPPHEPLRRPSQDFLPRGPRLLPTKPGSDDPEETLVAALIEENQRRGVRPDGRTAGARWEREDDIPDRVYFRAVEALHGAGPKGDLVLGPD